MADVTFLLDAAAAGDRHAAAELLPIVYDELRKLAAVRMADEATIHGSGQQATYPVGPCGYRVWNSARSGI